MKNLMYAFLLVAITALVTYFIARSPAKTEYPRAAKDSNIGIPISQNQNTFAEKNRKKGHPKTTANMSVSNENNEPVIVLSTKMTDEQLADSEIILLDRQTEVIYLDKKMTPEEVLISNQSVDPQGDDVIRLSTKMSDEELRVSDMSLELN